MSNKHCKQKMHRLINRGGPTLGAIAPTTKKKSLKSRFLKKYIYFNPSKLYIFTHQKNLPPLKSYKIFLPPLRKILGSAPAHQACGLRSDLEQSLKDNASLFVKIGKH